MKTAISLPDNTYERATRAASMLGVSRSELFARAMDDYLDRQAESSVTDQINAVVDREGLDDASRDVSVLGLLTITAATIDDAW